MTDPVVEQPIVPPPEPETPEPANDPVTETDPESEAQSGADPTKED